MESLTVASLQMNTVFGRPLENLEKAKKLIFQAAETGADVAVLPETWNTGFFPRENLLFYADVDGRELKREMGAIAKQCAINIVAGSIPTLKNQKIFNTCYVFNRRGECFSEYDKAHLFSLMDEDRFFTPGNTLSRFELEGFRCGVILCYDLRFPEWARLLATKGLDVLFVPSQWPAQRLAHLDALLTARAIENQVYVIGCNACGRTDDTVFGGGTMLVDPRGEILAKADNEECAVYARCDAGILKNVRMSMNVFGDRRPELYRF